MSLRLNMGTKPYGVEVKTHNSLHEVWISYPIPEGGPELVSGKPGYLIAMSMEDFCVMVRYVMENSDLLKGDARLELIKRFKTATIGRGYNGPNSRKVNLGKLRKSGWYLQKSKED